MGMIGHLKRIPETLLKDLKQDPSAIESMVVGDVASAPTLTEEMLSKMPPEVAKMMAGNMKLLKEMKSEAKLKTPKGADIPAISIEKEWQAIHYLLTGDPWKGDGVLAKAILGGKEIGEDLGYGPARYLTPTEVREIHKALNEISEKDLKSRFNPKEMTQNEIYPGHWEAECFEGVWLMFKEMASYYQQASNEKQAMLLYIA